MQSSQVMVLSAAVSRLQGMLKTLALQQGPNHTSKCLWRRQTFFCSAACVNCVNAQALVSLDQIPVEQLRPEFKQGVASLLQLIFAKVRRASSGTQSL